jgi:hypothetical protein
MASGAVIVTAQFTMPSPIDIEVLGSSIGHLDTTLLAQGINDIAKTIVLPWLNYKGLHQVQISKTKNVYVVAFASHFLILCHQGFAIPVPHGLQLSNSSVTVGESYVAISSDVHLE